jgi:lantibiotic modifying enzyme
MRIDRREWLAGVPGLLLAACSARSRGAATPTSSSTPADDLATARGAAAFIRSHAVSTKDGLAWHKSPDEPSVEADLYHGGAGPALFLLELHRATGDKAALDEALAGARHIVATWPDKPRDDQIGFHGGLGGHALLLAELAKTSKAEWLAPSLADAIARLEHAATPGPKGGLVLPMNDMLYGNAGVALVLLALGDAKSIALATQFGDGLLGRAEPADHGQHWHMIPNDERELPNFSHGTAGVAYALARLYEVTHEQRFLDGALAGAKYLLSIARTAGGVCLVPHSLPDGAERYYLAYCHGPAGTSRLFHQLHRVTGDASWHDWFERSVAGVLQAGLPEARTPGFWDNVGQCCGTAAVAELMLSLHRLTGRSDYVQLARALADDIAARATRHPDGSLEWIHQENRNEPYWKQSYTGYMQGAAGIGSLFLRIAGHAQHAAWKVRLPDNPFPIV